MTAVTFLALAFLGFGMLLQFGLEGFTRTVNDVTVTNQNAQNMRRITDALRGAINVTISNSGTTISFNNPKLSGSVNATTGEKELIYPLTSDGIARGYSVNTTTGKLTETQSGRVLVQNIISTDPQVGSSQYGQTYAPFSNSIIGGSKAVTVNLITQAGQANYVKYERFKTTVYLRS